MSGGEAAAGKVIVEQQQVKQGRAKVALGSFAAACVLMKDMRDRDQSDLFAPKQPAPSAGCKFAVCTSSSIFMSFLFHPRPRFCLKDEI